MTVGETGVFVDVAVGKIIIPVGVAVEVGRGVGVRDGVDGTIAVLVVVGVPVGVPVGDREGTEVLVAKGVGLSAGVPTGWMGSKRPMCAITPAGLAESTTPSMAPAVCTLSPPG